MKIKENIKKVVNSIKKKSTIAKRQSKVKRINQRLADAWKKGKKDAWETKELEKAIIATGHYKEMKDGRPVLINDKWWDSKENVYILNSLEKRGTTKTIRTRKVKQKQLKEKELEKELEKYEDMEYSDEDEDDKKIIQQELKKVKEQTLEEYIEEEENLHEFIMSNLETIYLLDEKSTRALRRSTNLTVKEETQLRELINKVNKRGEKEIDEIMKNKKDAVKVGE